MLSLPFIRDNSRRRPQGDRGQECRARSRRLARARRRGARAEDAGRRACGPSATRSATASRAPRPRSGRRLGAKAKAIGAEIGEVEGALGEQQAALDALLLRVPNIPWEGAPVGPDESCQCRRPPGRDDPQLRFRAARPCRPDREERLGGSGADHPGGGLAHLLPQGPAGPARAGADALGAAAARRRRLHPDDACRRWRGRRPSSPPAISRATRKKPIISPPTTSISPAPARSR